MTFEDLKLKRQFLDAVEVLGYRLPTPIQSQAIPRILSGQDLIGVAQTGTGKTGAYLLPILQKLRGRQDGEPRAVVLVPTKELALQVHRATEAFAMHTDIRSIALVGGVGPKTQMASLESGADVVVATPGRFMELYLRGALSTRKIQTMVLDEADRMMDMGFMPQLRDIPEVVPNKRQNLLFSATFLSVLSDWLMNSCFGHHGLKSHRRELGEVGGTIHHSRAQHSDEDQRGSALVDGHPPGLKSTALRSHQRRRETRGPISGQSVAQSGV